ncbi:MAG: hypothetical protein R3F43_11020 [bacterium]
MRYRTTCKALLARIAQALATRQRQLCAGQRPPDTRASARRPVWSLERITLCVEPADA